MLLMVYRKLRKNVWLALCLLLACIIAVAMASSIPMFTKGILNKTLIKDLQSFQNEKGLYPGGYGIHVKYYGIYENENRAKAFKAFDQSIIPKLEKSLGLPSNGQRVEVSADYLYIPSEDKNGPINKMVLKAFSDMKSHVKIISGRVPGSSLQDGVCEVMVTKEAMKSMNLIMDKVYTVKQSNTDSGGELKVRISGVFEPVQDSKPYWFDDKYMLAFENSIFMDYELFNQLLIEKSPGWFTDATWNYGLDYNKINLDNMQGITNTVSEQKEWSKGKKGIEIKMPADTILIKYKEKEGQLRKLLWLLQVPVLLLLAYFLLMITRLKIQMEQQEIAVLKSRGAGSGQIFAMYLIESLIICGAAFVAGPVLGLLLCRIIGGTNGFLEFVQRSALTLKIDSDAYFFGFIAILFCMANILISAFFASKATIVEYKSSQGDKKKSPLWKKIFLDILMLLISGYGFYNYQSRLQTLNITGAKAGELAMDPLLLFISTIFSLGAGLLFLRVFPYLIKGIFSLGKRFWSPVQYVSLLRIARLEGQGQFIMLFLILTMSIGIFSANTARSINKNLEDQIRYKTGGEMALEEKWTGGPVDLGTPGQPNVVKFPYVEPPFERFKQLDGVETATRVMLQKDGYLVRGGGWVRSVQVMGIISDEFAKVGWFRDDLLAPYHWYSYCNLLSKDHTAVLISKDLRDEARINPGDRITVGWSGNDGVEATVYGVVNYWPGIYSPNGQESKQKNLFIVGNLPYFQMKTELEPYQIWMKKREGADIRQIYDSFRKNNIAVKTLNDADQLLVLKKNDSTVQGTNGTLTMGFVVTLLLCSIGFLIYWIISIGSRVLQFGVFRAMGMSFKKVMAILVWEQMLTSGTSIVAGIIIGGVTSDIFASIIQIMQDAKEQVLPFQVVAMRGDYFKLYGVVGIMLMAVMFILSFLVHRININQALKLGEE